MSNIVSYSEVEDRVLSIRGENVILDRDVAELYGVETKRVNEAAANNPEKFPEGYIITLDAGEWDDLRSKYSTTNVSSMTRVPPKAFTEKGLYMLATILKSPRATETTIAIVEAFAKMRELSGVMSQLPVVQDDVQQQAIMLKGGDILRQLMGNNELEISGDETSLELSLPGIKLKRTIKREKKKKQG